MQGKLQDCSVIICGVLSRDAEYKTVGEKNSSLTKFGVKVGERPSVNADEKSEAIWCNCVCWHNVAKAAKNLKKLDVVFCVGKIVTQKGTGEHEGKTFTSLECEIVLQMGTPVTVATSDTGQLPADLKEYEEILGDGQLPF